MIASPIITFHFTVKDAVGELVPMPRRPVVLFQYNDEPDCESNPPDAINGIAPVVNPENTGADSNVLVPAKT